MQSYNRASTLLQSCGFTIEKQELKDWHFNEFEIVMKGKKLQLANSYITAHNSRKTKHIILLSGIRRTKNERMEKQIS